jgi:hypothetical protein
MRLQSVTLFTQTQQLIGQFDAHARRLSDWLNDPQTDFITLDSGQWYDLLAPDPIPVGTGQLTVRKERIQVAIPDDRPDPLRPRVPTDPLGIVLALELYHVEGTLNRRSSDPRLLHVYMGPDSRTFVPLTDATVRFLPNPRANVTAPVVVVRSTAVDGWWLTNP